MKLNDWLRKEREICNAAQGKPWVCRAGFVEDSRGNDIFEGFHLPENGISPEMEFTAHVSEEYPRALDMIERLHTTLTGVLDEYGDAIGYVPEYFRDKWRYVKSLNSATKELAELEGMVDDGGGE